MAVVVVGGHTRNIGKTSVVAGLIAAMPERRWTALKITQFGHGVCSANGEPCDCETADHTIAVSEERRNDTGTDTARYLAAGAAHAFWVRTRQGQLHEAMPRVRQLLASSEHCIVESNSILRFVRPDLALFIADGRVADFKPSALRYLDRVDALVLTGESRFSWTGVAPSLLRGKPQFRIDLESFCTMELERFVAKRLGVLQSRPSGLFDTSGPEHRTTLPEPI